MCICVGLSADVCIVFRILPIVFIIFMVANIRPFPDIAKFLFNFFQQMAGIEQQRRVIW